MTTAQGLRVSASCNEACTIKATLTVSNAIKRRAGLSSNQIGTATATLTAAGVSDLFVVLTEEARRELRNFRATYVAILTVSATDSSSGVTNFVQRIRVE